MAIDPRLAAYLMQTAGAMGQGGMEEAPLIPPAPPGYPPNTQPLPMDMMPQGAAPPADPMGSSVSQDIIGTEDLSSKGLDKIEHKGLFGVKGTLRDILGVLGDTYLVANGRPGTYGDIRRKENQGAIMAGGYQNDDSDSFINNPLKVIQDLAARGYGKESQGLYKDYTENQRAEATAKLNEARLGRQEARDDVLAAKDEVLRQKGIQDIAARTYGGIQDEATLAQFNERFRPILEKNGLGHIPLPKNLREAKGWGIDTYRSNVLEDRDVGLGIQQQNADTNARRPSPRPRADSPLEYFREVSSIPANQRTPEEAAFIKKYTATGRGGSSRTGTIGGASAPRSPVGQGLDMALGAATAGRPGAFTGQTRTNKRTGVTQTWDGTRWK